MTIKYFSDHQILPFILSFITLIGSVICFHLNKKKISLILLFIGSLGLGFFIANLDPFLMLWDEQYHALVAKHMTENPFKPTLYSIPLLEYDYRNWTGNHIWLHKQPLFLWQMALSLKIFGFNELAVRLPSIVLHAFATLMIYRIGKISYSDTVGYYGAIFFAVAYYPLELIAGRFSTDHNDVSFLFYITASFWSWFEYQRSNKTHWLILTGLFSGCAVLVKWLVGLLVYAVWIITIVANERKNRIQLKSYYPLLLSLFITFLVFIPWQLYILYKYPLEAKFEFIYNTRHFFEVIEYHGGNSWFHFKALKDIYGEGDAVPYIYLLGLILLLKNVVSNTYRVAILSAIVITYTFYTLAATKMTSFCIIVSPFAFLGLAALIDSFIKMLQAKIPYKKFELFFRPMVLISMCFVLINLTKIANHHTMWKPNDNGNRNAELAEMGFIKKLTDQLKTEKYVVFNATIRMNGHIPIMFYTDYIAYDFIPTEKQIEQIKISEYKIAILDKDSLPGFIRTNNDIVKIKL